MLKKAQAHNLSLSMIRNAKGMTLLEIMIVLIILASLLGILGNQVVKQLAKAKIKEAQIQMAEIGKALDMFYTECGSYPSALDGLVTQPAECSNWGPEPYLKKLPKDPWNHDFVYESTGSSYELISLGADGKQGGSGNNSDINSENL